MADETEVFKAIEDTFVGDATLVNLCQGGIFFQRSPEKTPLNRIVYEDEGTQGSIRTYAGFTTKQHILFKVFAESGDQLSQIIGRLEAVFTGKVFNLPASLISGGGQIKIDEIRRYKQREPKRSKNFKFVWVAEVPYQTLVNQ